MPVSNTNPIIEYNGNAVSTVFSYPFQIVVSADLKAYLAGVLQSSGYTVTGVGNSGGGSITFSTAPATGVVVRLQRIVTTDRSTDYIEGGGLAAATLDADFDRAVMMVQDLNSQVMKINSNNEYDAENQKIVNLSTPTVSTDATTKQYVDTQILTGGAGGVFNSETFTATAGQTVFTLTNSYTVGINSLNVYINGVHQQPDAYTETDATTITFSAGLDAGDTVEINAVVPVAVNTIAAGNVTVSGGTNVQAFINKIITGTGTPENAVSAVVSSLYLRDDGGTNTTFYVKESGTGNTGWVAK